MRKMLIPFALCLIACGCEGETAPAPPSDHDLGNLLFPSAEHEIVTSLPAHESVTDSIPDFTWVQTSQPIVFVGVFDENVQIQNARVVNVADNVWAWHTGLGTGREGFITFAHGRNVVDGVIQVDAPPRLLESGRSYVWAVWAWDASGRTVTHSSQEIFFTVE
ncbi:hypothetical protein ACFL6M_08040 [Candidatus Eisenbacteria bacterium]|uniref:Lipoprotein n=1 Tax=Eiseniibacteriota bacterium TaxID=2212470 RepID=A0ABV6YMX1_UNCEI